MKLTQLLAYRDILINKQNNPDYAEHFSVEDIAGKVIRLTAGCELRCPKVNQVCIPTTTSTTTISCAITGGDNNMCYSYLTIINNKIKKYVLSKLF